jgi:hypothetical protein
MKWLKKLLRKQNDKYPTTPSRLGKKVTSICSYCGSILKTSRMSIEPSESLVKNKLNPIFFDALINNKLEKNLLIEPSVHYSEKLVWKKLYKQDPVICECCKHEFQSVLSIKFMDKVILLCM